MTDEEIIIEAEAQGFRFVKHKNSWNWSVIAPDESFIITEQGDQKGMEWLRKKLKTFCTNSPH